MKLVATLDFWDGRPGVTRDCHAEDLTGSAIVRSLWNPGVASITFTRPPDLLKVAATEGE